MNFCNICAGTIIIQKPKDDHLDRFVCVNCNIIHYQNPKVIVGCIPIFEDKIMLCRRGIEPMKAMWNLPAGFMENNETLQEGAIREVMEETGVNVAISHLVTVFTVKHFNQIHFHFLAEMQDANWNLTPESTEIKLFSIDEIPWDDIAFKSNTFTLKNYINSLKLDSNSISYGVSDLH